MTAVAASTALAGCILFGIDDLEGSSADGGSTDTSIDDAPTEDVVSTTDSNANVGLDSGNDANFCANATDASIYCEDFDEGDGSAAYLGSADQHGVLSLDPAIFASPPRSMQCTRTAVTIADAAGQTTSIHAQVNPNASAGFVHAAFDFYAPVTGGLPPATSQPTGIFTVVVAGSGQIELNAGATSLVVVETSSANATTSHSTILYSIATGAWVHIEMILDMTAETILVKANGVSLGAASPAAVAWAPGLIQLKYGLDLTEDLHESAADIHMDNISITTN